MRGDAIGCGGVGGQEIDADLLLLHAALGGRLDVAPDGAGVGGVGGGVDGDGLDEELVAAAGVGGRVLFHGLQQDLDFDSGFGRDFARVGAYAVSEARLLEFNKLDLLGRFVAVLFRRGRLDFECDGIGTGIAEAQDLGDLLRKGAFMLSVCTFLVGIDSMHSAYA